MSALELSTSYSTVIISFRFNCFRLIVKNNHKNILVLHLTNVPNHCKRIVDASFPTLVVRFLLRVQVCSLPYLRVIPKWVWFYDSAVCDWQIFIVSISYRSIKKSMITRRNPQVVMLPACNSECG